MYASVAVGSGIAERTITIPSRRSDRRLSTGLFPTLEVGLQGEIAVRRVLFGAAASYHTAVGLQAAAIAPRAGNSVDGAQLRSNSLTFGITPGYRFGRTYESVALRVFFARCTQWSTWRRRRTRCTASICDRSSRCRSIAA
jgi:hypothetical protein